MMLQGFCRLFLSIQDDSDETRIQLHIRPDVTQPNDLIGVISCASLEALGICLEELGVSGVATQISETNSGPVSGFISSSVPEILRNSSACTARRDRRTVW